MSEPKQKKMGRPKISASEKRLPSMGFRPTPDLRQKLEEAAAKSGMSLTQVIEDRLRRSFEEEDAIGGAELYALFRLLAACASLVEARTEKSWSSDWETGFVVRKAWEKLIREVVPNNPQGTDSDFDPPPGILRPPKPPKLPSIPSFTEEETSMHFKNSIDFVNEVRARWDEYNTLREKYDEAMHERLEELQEWRQRYYRLEDLANDAVKGLFPERQQKG